MNTHDTAPNFLLLDWPVFDFQTDLTRLLASNAISWSQNQICLNTVADQPDNIHLGVGNLYYDWKNAIDVVREDGHIERHVPKLENPLLDSDFTMLCSQFKDTAFEEAMLQLSRHYRVGRVRLMKMSMKSCLTWHVDYSPRIHYPIITGPGAMMVIDTEVMHLEQNQWYWTNTTRHHTALNGSSAERIHLVAAVE